MVRGGGFEPPTPTVSKSRSNPNSTNGVTPTEKPDSGEDTTLTRYGSGVRTSHRAPSEKPVFAASSSGIVFYASKVPEGGGMPDSANGSAVGLARCD